MKQLISLGHYLLQIIVRSPPHITHARLPKNITTQEYVASMFSHCTRYKFNILHLLPVTVTSYEFISCSRVLSSKGSEPSRNHSYREVVDRADSFPEKQRKLIYIVIKDQLHVVKSVLVGRKQIYCCLVIDMCQYDQVFAM